MAEVVSIAERDFPATRFTRSFSTQAAAAKFKVVFTHPEWPAGTVLRARVTWDGALAAEFATGGGVRIIKGGGTRPAGDLTLTSFTLNKPEGVTDLSVIADVLQPMRSAVSVERL